MKKANNLTMTLKISATAEQMKSIQAFMDTLGIGYEALEDVRTEPTPEPKAAPKSPGYLSQQRWHPCTPGYTPGNSLPE